MNGYEARKDIATSETRYNTSSTIFWRMDPTISMFWRIQTCYNLNIFTCVIDKIISNILK